MSAPLRPLSPLGTARTRFEGIRGDSVDALFDDLRERATRFDLADDSLYLVEELVRMAWSLGERDHALALLILTTFVAGRQGSTRVPIEGGPKGPLGCLLADLGVERARIGRVLAGIRAIAGAAEQLTFAPMVGPAEQYRPLIVADGCIYQHRMLRAEERLVEHLRRRLDGDDLDDSHVEAALNEVTERPPVRAGRPLVLSAEQADAVRLAARRPLSVVSGGPGTGKTAIVVSLLRLFVRIGVEPTAIALAAPTGKAANRMAGSIQSGLSGITDPGDADIGLLQRSPVAQTLHRLLGYQPWRDGFRHHDNNPLAHRVVVVDEASMIDLPLMERLVRSLAPETRLILLGDADQLPSVEAGAVLRDLIGVEPDGRRPFAVQLTRSYRMDPSDPEGSSILSAARAIDAGRAEALWSDGPARLRHRTRAEDLSFAGAEHLDTRDERGPIADLLEVWYRALRSDDESLRRMTRTYRYRDGGFDEDDRAALDALFAHHGARRLLTATRRLPTGAEALNARLHERMLADSGLDHAPPFCPGEPVIVQHNDYARGLFNGDQGIVVRTRDDDGTIHFRVVFPRPDDYAIFHLDALRAHIELAFAITIHKSQGSEFDRVAVVLPPRDLPIATRELLYTGVTRARRSAVLVGSTERIRAAVSRRVQRWSGIRAKLRPA